MTDADGDIWSPGRPEPRIRIGVVLTEDGKSRVAMTLRIPCRVGPGEFAPGDRIVFESAEGKRVRLRSDRGPAPETAERFVVEPLVPPEDPAVPTALVHGIVAGRSFHWRKEIDVSYAGSFEIRAGEGSLVVVNRVGAESYLLGVITGEMSGECPLDLLKAQAVAARSWLLAHPAGVEHPGSGFQWCNDDCCQRYHGTDGVSDSARRALEECRGEILLTASGAVCDANYSKSCGGILADPVAVWGRAKEGQHVAADAPAGDPVERFLPVREETVDEYVGGEWLRRTRIFCSPNVVPEADIPRYLGRVDEGGGFFRWETEISAERLAANLAEKTGREVERVRAILPRRREASGRLTEIEVRFRDGTGADRSLSIRDQYRIRETLHPAFLFSSAVVVREEDRDGKGFPGRFRYLGAGWGHGAGLCQIGALGMAIAGHAYDRILAHYFEKTRRTRAY